MVEALIEAGADATARNATGETPLHSAASRYPNPAVMQVLLDARTDLEARDGNGRTALHLAASASERPGAVEFLLDAGADATAVDDGGRTVRDLLLANDSLKRYGTSYQALLQRVPATD